MEDVSLIYTGVSNINPEAQDERIEMAKESIGRYLKRSGEITGSEYELRKIEQVDAYNENENGEAFLFKLKTFLTGINCHCAENRVFWILFREDKNPKIIYTNNYFELNQE